MLRVIVYFQTIAGTFVKRVVLVSWKSRSYEQKLFFLLYLLRIFEVSWTRNYFAVWVYIRLGLESEAGRQRQSNDLQPQRQGDAKQLSSRQTQTYCCAKWVQTACPLEDLERAAFSTHNSIYHEAVLSNFSSSAKTCEKLMFQGVVSEISSFLQRSRIFSFLQKSFSCCRKSKQWNNSFPHAAFHLRACRPPFTAYRCLSVSIEAPPSQTSNTFKIQSKEAGKPYKHSQKKLHLEAIQSTVILHLFWPKRVLLISHKFPSSVVFVFQNSIGAKQ